MKILVRDRQSFLDVCLQYAGGLDYAIQIANENSINPSDDIEAGREIEIPEEYMQDKNIAAYFFNKDLAPATALSDSDAVYGGINYMGIEIDFIVS